MAFSRAVFTRLGLSLQAKLETGTPLKLTRAVSSDNSVEPSLLYQQTEIQRPKQTLTMQTVYTKENKAYIELELSNAGLETPYKLQQIGIYAEDPDLGEILYFISQDDDIPDTIPTSVSVPNYITTFDFQIAKANADNIKITVDPAEAVPRREFEEYKQELIEDRNTTPNSCIEFHGILEREKQYHDLRKISGVEV